MRSILPLFVAALAASAPALAVEQVPVPAFRAIELHGGGIVTVIPASVQRVTIVEGATQFTRVRVDREGKLEIDACNERCPADYHLRIRIETPSIMGLGVNGGGLMTTEQGFAPQREIGVAVNGGGKIDARSIDAAAVGAAVNGGKSWCDQSELSALESLAAAKSSIGATRLSRARSAAEGRCARAARRSRPARPALGRSAARPSAARGRRCSRQSLGGRRGRTAAVGRPRPARPRHGLAQAIRRST